MKSTIVFFSFVLFTIFLCFGTLECQNRTRTTSSFPPKSPAAASAPVKTACFRHPPNYRDIDLPCGGYNRESCQQVCVKLGHTRSYCRKEVFCLCHSNGDLYSC